MDKAVTEKYLQNAFYESEHFPGGSYNDPNEGTAEAYQCAVTDVMAWLCANATEISLSSDGQVQKLVIVGG